MPLDIGMRADEHLRDLIAHLGRSSALGPAEAERLVREVVAYFSESPTDFVARRHAELQTAGRRNTEIFEQLGRELGERRFAAPALSDRQIRRLIYG